MNAAATFLRKAASLAQHGDLKTQVALLSRQSAAVSADYRALAAELEDRLGADGVVVDVCASELEGTSSFARNALHQMRIAARSKVVVVDGYSPAVCIPPKKPGRFVVQLWHATGAMKKFGRQSLDTLAGRSSSYAALAHMHENYDRIIAAGPGAVDAYAEAFGCPAGDVLALGTPHTDYLLQTGPESQRMQAHRDALARLPFLACGSPNILYAPTLRKGKEHEGWAHACLKALVETCPLKDFNLVFSGHPLENEAVYDLVASHPALHIARGVATCDLLESADIVVTDYSSVALDAGLLGKDVVFYVPDYEEYAASPGLNVDVCSPDVAFASTSAQELMQGVAAALESNPPSGIAAFKAFASDYFAGIRPGATQRIADLICDKLDESASA